MKPLEKFKEWREDRRRARARRRHTAYHVEDLAPEDAQHDETASLDEKTPTVRWIEAEEGHAGYRHHEWLEQRAEPLGKPHVKLARLRQEHDEVEGHLAKESERGEQLAGQLNRRRLRWFQNGLTLRRLLVIVSVVFVAEALANYVAFAILPLPVVGQLGFAMVFTILLAGPAHYTGVLGVDAIFNWDRRGGPHVVERVHQKVVLVTALILLAFDVGLTGALAGMRDAYFAALRERNPEGLFALVEPTWLTLALLLGALAGVIVIILVAAVHQAGELRRKWTAELQLSKAEIKQLQLRAERLRIEIAETEARYDVVAEKQAARGLRVRRRGQAVRAQFDRRWVNEQRRLGREPDLPEPEPAPDPAPYYKPIYPAHERLTGGAEQPETAAQNGQGNGAGDYEEAQRRLAEVAARRERG